MSAVASGSLHFSSGRLRGLPRRSVPSALKECCSGIISSCPIRVSDADTLIADADRNLDGARDRKVIHDDLDWSRGAIT